MAHPDGPDAYFWLQWIMTEAGDDASDMQNFLLRSGAFKGLDFRRFQISLDMILNADRLDPTFGTILGYPDPVTGEVYGVNASCYDLMQSALPHCSQAVTARQRYCFSGNVFPGFH